VSNYKERIQVRLKEKDMKIVNRIKEEFSLSSDSEAVRFIINLWWKSLGTDAVDEEELGEILARRMTDPD